MGGASSSGDIHMDTPGAFFREAQTARKMPSFGSDEVERDTSNNSVNRVRSRQSGQSVIMQRTRSTSGPEEVDTPGLFFWQVNGDVNRTSSRPGSSSPGHRSTSPNSPAPGGKPVAQGHRDSGPANRGV